MGDTAIKLDDVSKQFGPVIALDSISLQVDQTEVYGLLGPNGAGKSTLLDLLVGFRSPTSGSVRVLQMDPRDRPRAIRRRVGILPDAVSVNPNWSGRRHLEFAIDALGTDETPEAALERVELGEAVDRSAGEYSKGMRQRLILAMSLIGNPDLLLLDEPSTGVDPAGMKIIREIITEEKEKGVTVVFSSHRLGQVETIADRVGVLIGGEITENDISSSATEPSHSILHVHVDTPPSSLANITAIDGVSNARVHPNGVEVLCSDTVKKRVLDIIEDECGTIYNIKTESESLEETFLDLLQ